ncbi:unnamed protein product [Vitrella brassicaformis CCMP3155]|uniref:Secreted protein n=1 Tax=Vitrella brassicaformis (strain CCMP3155) TaxID=1169540 RepID=A0A0G4GUC6_VITBC|nr:unnamed protein product [Vitrella brassicaformis CCMP3155]|eukprot:CEM34406.1 unnamed protein product [Vitrella brassicaformis CCMP3155]
MAVFLAAWRLSGVFAAARTLQTADAVLGGTCRRKNRFVRRFLKEVFGRVRSIAEVTRTEGWPRSGDLVGPQIASE